MSEWKRIKLSECCQSIADGDHQPPPKAETGIPFVTISNMTSTNQFDFSDTLFVPQDYYDNLDDKRKAKKNDILYSVVGSFGIPVFMKEDKEFVFQRHIAILRPNEEEIVPRFLFYNMLTRDFYAKADAVAVGAAQRTVSLTALRDMEINIPTKKEQSRIVKILSAYDDLIENNQKQIMLLEEAAQRLYKEWFVNLRFPGYEKTRIEDGIPDSWNKISILDNEIFEFVKSSVLPFDGEKHYYATADVISTQLTGKGELITFMNKPSRASVQPIKNSVWFARMSNSYKILNFFGDSNDLADNSIISSGFAGFTSREEYYGFVYETIASKWFDDEKNLYATGATQVSLTNEGLKRINVLLPSMELIEKYSHIVNPYLRKCEALKKSIALLKEARNRLIPKLMSGEIKL